MKIVMLGGSGYIGSNTLKIWLNEDEQAAFYVLSRSGKTPVASQRVHGVQADATSLDSVEAAVPEHFDAIVDFVGGMTDLSLNVEAAKVTREVAEKHGAKVIGYVAGSLGGSKFVRSKDEASSILRASGIPCVVVNPTLVYGNGRDDAMAKLVPLMKLFGIFSKKLRPVTVDEVARELIDGITEVI